MLNMHALEINRTTGTILPDGQPISVIGKVVPCLDVEEGELSALITIPLASITVKTAGGSVRVDKPEAGE